MIAKTRADTRKTAFATPSGLYEFVSAPFGLTSVPGAFQRFMQFVLADHIEAGYCVVYCDDIAIFSQSDDPLSGVGQNFWVSW
jgi:hypothetical protein